MIAEAPSTNPAVASDGLGVLKYGCQTPTGPDRYQYVVVGRCAAADAAARAPSSKVLVYHNGSYVNKSWNTGITYAEAVANQWVALNSWGSEVPSPSDPSNVLAVVGNPGYQARWAWPLPRHHSGSRRRLIDDAHVDLGLPVYPAAYPNQQAWQDAMASFLAYVGPALRARGYYVAANTSGFVHGDTRSNDGTMDVLWWQRIGPSLDGLFHEYFQQAPHPDLSRFFNDPLLGWKGTVGRLAEARPDRTERRRRLSRQTRGRKGGGRCRVPAPL